MFLNESIEFRLGQVVPGIGFQRRSLAWSSVTENPEWLADEFPRFLGHDETSEGPDAWNAAEAGR